MATMLQELRKEAGYRTAKEFAEAIEVPPTTYARYEQSPEKIPIKQAWMIADHLGCSIDAVVGREHIDIDSMRGEVQRFYDSVSEENRHLLDEFFTFIRSKEYSAESRKKRLEQIRYEELVRELNTQFFESSKSDDNFFNRAVFGDPREEKINFLIFVSDQLEEQREEEIEEVLSKIRSMLDKKGVVKYSDSDSDTEYVFDSSDPDYEEKLNEFFEHKEELLREKKERRDKEEVEKISDAYERMRRRRSMSERNRLAHGLDVPPKQ